MEGTKSVLAYDAALGGEPWNFVGLRRRSRASCPSLHKCVHAQKNPSSGRVQFESDQFELNKSV